MYTIWNGCFKFKFHVARGNKVAPVVDGKSDTVTITAGRQRAPENIHNDINSMDDISSGNKCGM